MLSDIPTGDRVNAETKRLTWRTVLPAFSRLLATLPGVVHAERRGNVDAAFREKVMLTVSAVNGCQYCVRFHTG